MNADVSHGIGDNQVPSESRAIVEGIIAYYGHGIWNQQVARQPSTVVEGQYPYRSHGIGDI